MLASPIVLATSANAREMSTEDDALLDALGVLGVPVQLVNWDDAGYPWNRAALVLLRTTWDYHVRLDEFLAWVDRVSAMTTLLNSPALVRWNADKRYLLELEWHKVRIVPTKMLESGAALRDLPVETVVLKPSVAAGAYETLVFEPHEGQWSESVLTHADRLSQRGTFLVQPYIDGITREGETSLVFFEGEFHHAVRKTPAPGDFRVQVEFGGRYQVVAPSPAQLDLAHRAVGACPELPLYARVDLVEFESEPCLMELELIEPELFFLWVPEAALVLADLLRERRSEAILL